MGQLLSPREKIFVTKRKEKEERKTAGREDLEGYTKTCCDTLDLLIRIHLCGQGHPIENQLVLLTTSAVRRLIPGHLQLDDMCPFPEPSTRSQ